MTDKKTAGAVKNAAGITTSAADLNAVKAKLFDLITRGVNLNEICNYVAELIGNPVALALPTRTFIAHSENYTDELIRDYIRVSEFITDEERQQMDETFNSAFTTGKAGIYVWEYSPCKRLNCGCIFNGKYIAVLDSPVINSLPGETELAISEVAAQAFVVLMQKANLVRGGSTEPMHGYLSAILRGDLNAAYQWTFRKDFHFHALNRFQLVIMVPKTEDARLPKEYIDKVFTFCSMRKSWWCVRHEEGFVILIGAADKPPLNLLSDSFSENYYICASDVFSNLRNLSTNLSLCRMAVKFHSSAFDSNSIIYVDDMKPLIAYYYAYSNSNLQIFENNTLNSISEYDKKFGTAYLETLRVSIHYNQDPELIAKALHIHKNTVFYRVRQLKELFNINLKDTRQLVNYYLVLSATYHSTFVQNQEE